MRGQDRRVDPAHLYLGAVAVLAGASILLMYLTFRVAGPAVFNAFVRSPVVTVRDNPRSVALFVAALLVTGLLVVAVVALGARAANQAQHDREHPPRK